MGDQKSLKVQFELTEDDFEYFRDRFEQARAARAQKDETATIDGASQLVAAALAAASSKFISKRITQLNPFIAMLRDPDWRLEGEDRERVLDVLAYFTEGEDLIPDATPVIGYLDDAIMIELVVRELGEEIKAYADFCDFRDRKGREVTIPLLEDERESLQRRMRRESRAGGEGGSRRSPFSLF